MVKEKYDYSLLLDSLRNIFSNYNLTIYGEVVNRNGDRVRNNQIIANTRFGVLYGLAYRKLIVSQDDSTKDKLQSIWALTDYSIFNSFMNNCLNEYSIYGDVGTGNILYVPYQELATYIFDNKFKKDILIAFLNNEKENIRYIQENFYKGKVKSL